jgi:hypothetical protein
MRSLLVGSLAAVGTSAALTTQSAGFLPGEIVPILVSSPDGAFAGSAQVQTSVDGTVWNNAGAIAASAGTKLNAIRLENFIRLNCTARTAGTIEAVTIGAAD